MSKGFMVGLVMIKGACRIGPIINCTVLAINPCIARLGGKKGCLLIIPGKSDKYRGACVSTSMPLKAIAGKYKP